MVDRKFLREIQHSGWSIEQVGKRQVIARCPAEGCGMRALLSSGAPIPKVDPDFSRSGLDRPVESYDDFRRILRERRESLALTLHELEDMVGVATDYLAKAEKEDPFKMPNIQTGIDWAGAVGLAVVLMPTDREPGEWRSIPNFETARWLAQFLGYEIKLVPGNISEGYALQMIADTRDKVGRRRRRVSIDRQRRGAGTRPYREGETGI